MGVTRRSEPVKGGVSTNDCHRCTCVPCVCGVRPVRAAFSMFQWRPAAHETGGEMAASACTPKLWVTAKPMGSMGLDRRRERFETKQGSRLRGAPDKPLTHQRLARRGSPPQWAPRLALGKGLLSGSVSTLEAESRSGQQRAGIVIGLGSIGIFLDGRLHPRGKPPRQTSFCPEYRRQTENGENQHQRCAWFITKNLCTYLTHV